MDNNEYIVMIAGQAKAGMEEYIKRNLIQMMEYSRKDEGCIIYNIHESINDPGEFMVYMVWKDETSFEKHNQKPEMQEFRNKLAAEWFDIQSPKTFWHLLK